MCLRGLVGAELKEKTHLLWWALRMCSVADLRVEHKGVKSNFFGDDLVVFTKKYSQE